MQLATWGMRREEMADVLGVLPGTISTYRQAAREKTGSHTFDQAAVTLVEREEISDEAPPQVRRSIFCLRMVSETLDCFPDEQREAVAEVIERFGVASELVDYYGAEDAGPEMLDMRLDWWFIALQGAATPIDGESEERRRAGLDAQQRHEFLGPWTAGDHAYLLDRDTTPRSSLLRPSVCRRRIRTASAARRAS